MTEEQIHEAIRKMMVECDHAEADHYRTVSARSVLEKLGYSPSDTQEVLQHIAAGGFDYCLDSTIPMTGHHEAQGEKPDWKVCYWGPDQLKSRLQCLSNVPYAIRHTYKEQRSADSPTTC